MTKIGKNLPGINLKFSDISNMNIKVFPITYSAPNSSSDLKLD
jgi:hypothetical protein